MHPRTVSLSSSQILWFYEEPPFRAGSVCMERSISRDSLPPRACHVRSPNWTVRPGQEWLLGLDPLPPEDHRVPKLLLFREAVLQSPGISAQPKTPGFGVESPFHRWLLVVGVPCLLMDTFLPVDTLRLPLKKTSLRLQSHSVLSK